MKKYSTFFGIWECSRLVIPNLEHIYKWKGYGFYAEYNSFSSEIISGLTLKNKWWSLTSQNYIWNISEIFSLYYILSCFIVKIECSAYWSESIILLCWLLVAIIGKFTKDFINTVNSVSKPNCIL